MSKPPAPPAPPSPTPGAATAWRPLDTLSVGGWIILGIALVSTVVVFAWPIHRDPGLELWTFAKNHGRMYQRLSEDYNRQAALDGRPGVNVFVIGGTAMSRRTLSGFWSGTPLADLIEVERNAMTQYVSGPLEHIGFTDLTDRIRAEGLFEQINGPSFAPWTSRGRVFGLPHDVHPVLLCYRADLVEAAGIDVSRIETWDDFVRLMSPLIADLDGDGRADRYLLNLWYTQMDVIEAMILQAGGGTFDGADNCIVSSEANARVVAQCVAWMVGDGRIAIDAPNFSPSGNQQKIEGRVIAEVMPDWLAGIYKTDLPQLGGKLKLMPLPAWEKGGRRTSVQGGTMIGIPKATENFEAAWDLAKHLYLSPELARHIFESSNIISPVKSFWSADYYRQPDPYFSGQASGTAYIDQAPHVPFRSSNPFHTRARNLIGEVMTTLHGEATRGEHGPAAQVTADKLRDRAAALLGSAQARLLAEIDRNSFLRVERSAPAQARPPAGAVR